jgi:hypothetical protein
MLFRRNGEGDRERAEKLLARAQATYQELGMQGDAAKAAALARTAAHAQADANLPPTVGMSTGIEKCAGITKPIVRR